MLKLIFVYILAALAEIGGCFSFWLWLREGKSVWWLVPAMISLSLFGWLLTLVDTAAAGRAYAAYGGVYIAAALTWLWIVEGDEHKNLRRYHNGIVVTRNGEHFKPPSVARLKASVRHIRSTEHYWHLLFFNCNDFAVEVARWIGLRCQ